MNRLSLPLTFFLFVFSYQVQAYEDDGTWVDGTYWAVKTYGYGPTQTIACANAGGTFDNGIGSKCRGGSFAVIPTQHSCGAGAHADAQCGTPPTPPEPQDCTEASAQHDNDTSSVTLSSYSAEFCMDGCKANPLTMSQDPVTGEWTGTYQLTTQDCNGGYQSGLGAQDIIDFYAHDAELQNCYDAAGRLIGQISSTLTCPQLSVCYDATTGDPLGTTSSSTSCESGVKYNELAPELKDADTSSATTSTVNPDGTTTEVKETSTTQTGLDGSTSTTSSTTTTQKDSGGAVTSTETTSSTSSDNKAASNSVNVPNSCGNIDQYQCTGDVIQCEILKQELIQSCSTNGLTDAEVDAQLADQALIDKFGADRDSNGVLMALDKGTVDAAQTLGLDSLGDNGAAGSCPAPRAITLSFYSGSFDYQPICDYATTVRPIVIFAALFLAFVLVRRGLIGG